MRAPSHSSSTVVLDAFDLHHEFEKKRCSKAPKAVAEAIAENHDPSEAELNELQITQNKGSSTKEKRPKEEHASAPSNKQRRDDDSTRGQRSSRRPESKFSSYIPLNTTPEQVLMEVRDKQLLKWGNRMKNDADKWDKRKYYHFHHDNDHSTSDCFGLKEEIEALIHGGHLREYVSRREERAGRKNEQPSNGNNNEATREIYTIFGGYTGGDSNQAHKAHTWSIIHDSSEHQIHLTSRPLKEQRVTPCELTFTEEDARGVHHPHDDALVVAMIIANRKVFRNLVDTGSSADILFVDAFDKMGVGRS
ncbi:uncharacterized protein LOC131224981 [Magnolia sinica]|uniref:uncharacterized protein LOC131224981 n=1 Tax=Magnolia sinica TaxID=86752 RepID=UPI00265B5605|nr:uncharacterized protein LOC131224981 [Magnolia sinica]